MDDLGHKVIKCIDNALVKEREGIGQRSYLGASRLGDRCERAIQYEFLGFPSDEGRELTGRKLRIFEVGNQFEALALRWLRLAGFGIKIGGSSRQFGFSAANGRIKGHVDGIIMSVPDDIDIAVPALWECKSVNAKGWRELDKKGLADSYPTYAAQIALYQAYLSEDLHEISNNPALFMAINKDTQDIYLEMIPFNGKLAQEMSDRAVKIVIATEHNEILPRCTAKQDFFGCRFCNWSTRCWDK